MQKAFGKLLWFLISLVAAVSLSVVTGIINPAEKLNALWIVAATACFYIIAYRLYAAFLAARVLSLDPGLPTPSHNLKDGVDYHPTNRWVLFGHHFAAIAGAGPLSQWRSGPGNVRSCGPTRPGSPYRTRQARRWGLSRRSPCKFRPGSDMKKILIVDDDNELRANLSEVMAGAGYQTHEAASGGEAVEKAGAEDYDAVLLDLIMPKMSGSDVLVELRRVSPRSKVIMLTAFATIDNAVDAIKRGASD